MIRSQEFPTPSPPRQKAALARCAWLALFTVTLLTACSRESRGTAHFLEEGGDSWPQATFPLSIQKSGRYLVDAAGHPFLIHGTSPWSMIVELRREEVDAFLKDRRARGFNTLLLNLIEHKFAQNPPLNAYGEAPFLNPGDFGSPNEAYFDYADWVIGRAEQNGFLLLLVPAYMGNGGGDEGWYQELRRNDPATLREYGRFVAHRFSAHRNIIWMQGGDYSPPDKAITRAIAQGIEDVDPQSLQSAHCSPEQSSMDYWAGEPWLQLDAVYTYEPVYQAVERAFRRPEQLPFFLVESHYEGEYRSTPRQLRAQAFQALLGGAMGQVFGNSPVWHFYGPGLFTEGPEDWHEALDSPGARSMMHIRRLFESVEWWKLRPDLQHQLLIRGEFTGRYAAVAALANDQSFAMIDVGRKQSITVNLGRLRGPRVTASWYDPTAGVYSTVRHQPFEARGVRTFLAPRNSEGTWDQVLVLKSSE